MITLKKQERSQNNLTLQLKELEKEEQTKPKASRRKEIIKISAEINKIENRKITEKAMKPKVGSLKKINKIDKLLARWTKKKIEDIQVTKISNESRDN